MRAASKHGAVGFDKTLRLEPARSGITVNAVCPGFVETPMAQQIREGYADFCEHTGRCAGPEEVPGLVDYLVSDTAASITRSPMNVCGGLGN